MIQPPEHPWTRDMATCVDATRVLVFQRVQGDTYVIIEGGEVSLSDSETLKRLIEQLPGR